MLISLNLKAQEEINYFQTKNEYNAQVDDIFAKNQAMPYLLYIDGFDYEIINLVNYTMGPSVGFGYKHHFKKGAIRV